ncbi:MAG: Acetyl-CoA C-acyltransferase, partial [Frankiales bacterium]|nr:Acetyl-CoA C-acyltransferase [Frankiales bacterium]
MSQDVRVAGVGMVPFSKPSAGERYEDMAAGAVRAALTDSGVAFEDVQLAFGSYVYGDSTCGQAALYGVGMTGLPVINVNNNCSSGSSGLYLAKQAVASGQVDVALAFGFEQMQRGALVEHWQDRL